MRGCELGMYRNYDLIERTDMKLLSPLMYRQFDAWDGGGLSITYVVAYLFSGRCGIYRSQKSGMAKYRVPPVPRDRLPPSAK